MKSITVLKLKLHLTNEQVELLDKVSAMCRTGRNSAIEDWLLRMRGKPESDKQAGFGRSVNKDGSPKCKSESTKLYHAVSAAVPAINSQIRSAIAAGINTHLSAKVDWRRGDKDSDGKRLRRRDAILRYDDRPPFFSADEIPVPCKEVRFEFVEEPVLTLRVLVGGDANTIRVHTGRLPAGIKRLLRSMASGETKLCDSRFVKRNDEWFWHVPVSCECEQRGDREAVLRPRIVDVQEHSQSDRPFVVTTPDRTWSVGDGRYLIAQLARLTSLRKQIGWRYRQRSGAGHGRKKIDDAIRRRYLQSLNIVSEVRRRAIADIVRQCRRDGCGLLVYHEPTGPAKSKCWFTARGIDWDWTRFAGDLKNACARFGIAVEVRKMRISDVQKEVSSAVI